MSYYQFFYPDIHKYNPDNLSPEDIQHRISDLDDSIASTGLSIRLKMINCYYHGVEQSVNFLSMLWEHFIDLLKQKDSLETISWITSDLNEYSSVAINHARCDSKYQLQEDIESNVSSLNSSFERLALLAAIRPFNALEEQNSRSRLSGRDEERLREQESDYLLNDLQDRITEIFDAASDTVSELSRSQFMLDNFDTHKSEDDLYQEKQQKQNSKSSSELSDSSNSSNHSNLSD